MTSHLTDLLLKARRLSLPDLLAVLTDSRMEPVWERMVVSDDEAE